MCDNGIRSNPYVYERTGSIVRLGMDGSDLTKLVTKNILGPASIVVDPVGDRIWWADDILQCVE